MGEEDSEANVEYHCSNNSQVDTETSNEKQWSRQRIKLLITTRFKVENDFRNGKKKKAVLWNGILRDIKTKDSEFPFKVEEVVRKFNNMLTTYKRIKRRNKESGRERILWEFFDEFDNVYGMKHAIQAPEAVTISSLDNEENVQFTRNSNNVPDLPTVKKFKTSKNEEVIKFLKEQNALEEIREKREEERFEKLLEVEREKNQIERDKVKALINLKGILQEMLLHS